MTAILIRRERKVRGTHRETRKHREKVGVCKPSRGFPGGPAGKESACNAEDLGSIPGLGRPPGEGKGYPLQYSTGEFHALYSPWGCKEADTTERLSLTSQGETSEENNPANTLILDLQAPAPVKKYISVISVRGPQRQGHRLSQSGGRLHSRT